MGIENDNKYIMYASANIHFIYGCIRFATIVKNVWRKAFLTPFRITTERDHTET